MATVLQRLIAGYIQPALPQNTQTAEQPDTALAKSTRGFGYGLLPATDVTVLGSIGQPTDTDHDLLYRVYRVHVDVKACVQKWVSGVTSHGWHLEHRDPSFKPTDAWNALVNDTEAWLTKPNPNKTFSILAAEIIQHLGITGDAYWNTTRDRRGRPLEIWGMHPTTMRVKADEHGAVSGYVQRNRSGEDTDFAAKEVQHFRLPDPYNDLYGESPLSVVLEDVGLDLQAMRANRALFANGFKPSAVAILNQEFTPEEQQTAAEQLRTANIGASNAHRLTVLGGVTDLKQWGSNLKDMEFTQLRELSTHKITTAYGIPILLLGYHNTGDMSTSRVLERQTHIGTYRPLQQYTAQIITEEIMQPIDQDLRFVWNEPDFASPEEKATNFLLGEQHSIVQPNEVREQLGLDAIDGLDEEKKERADAAAAALLDGGTAPAKPGAKPVAGGSTDAPDEVDTSKRLSKSLSTDELEAIRDRREAQMDDLEATMIPQVKGYLSRHRDRLTAKLESAYATATKGIIDDQADAIAYGDAELDDRDLRLELYADLEPAARSGVGEAQLQIGFSMASDRAQAIVDQYLLKDALAYVTQINDTTREAIRSRLRDGLAAGEGIDDLKGRITGYFDEAQAYRAQTIARTEVARAYEDTNLKAMIESRVVDSEQWLTAKDDRVRPEHRLREGLIVPIGTNWGEIRPGQEINCRCTSIGIVKDPS